MANTECEKILKQIPLYIDNVLSDYENDEVIKHLKRCSDCRNEYDYLKAIMGATKDIPQRELPSDFHKNLMEKVKKQGNKKKKHYITLRHISAGVAVAAVIAISFVALGEVGELKDTKQPELYITPRLSYEPIQKEAQQNSHYDNDVKQKEKTVDKEKVKTKETLTEEKPHTKEEIPASISLDEELEINTIATVTLTEDNRDEALSILSEYEKDEIGYIVEDIEKIIEKLKEKGATVTTNNDSTNKQSYIILK